MNNTILYIPIKIFFFLVFLTNFLRTLVSTCVKNKDLISQNKNKDSTVG